MIIDHRSLITMDDLAEALSGFGVTKTVNDTAAPHPRYTQYKQKTGLDQNERRRRILENQKERRFNAKAHIRALNENSWDGLPYGTQGDDSMDTDQVTPKHPGRYYRDQLMFSEWMIEVPYNFVDEWLMVACPVGKRCLVIAGSGYSSAYTRSGHYLFESFQSHLPGGCKRYSSRSDSTILDCIYCYVTRTFHILDMMSWNDMEVYNTDIEFRLFWLHSKLSEWEEDLTLLKESNEFRFVPLDFTPCDDVTISKTLESWKPEELDGLLFYHKQVHYLFGTSPLCLWLQAYMLPDLLGIPVPDTYIQHAPSHYVNFQHHLDQVKEKKDKLEERDRKWKKKKTRTGPRVEGGGCVSMDDGNVIVNQSEDNNLQAMLPTKKKNRKKKKLAQDGKMQTEAPPGEAPNREAPPGENGEMQTEAPPGEDGGD